MRTDPPPGGGPPGVYVHVPFCAVKCAYCDFPVAARQEHRVERYLAALEREIDRFAPDLGGPADTLYLGGGTPSRVGPAAIGRAIAAVRARCSLASDVEITLEANPEDLDDHTLAGFREVGVDRLSVGVQSLDDAVLRRAGRPHDAARALDALARARRHGFRSVNADLIGGLPGERLDGWAATVDRVVGADPDHVSFYLLEVDQSSALAKAVRAGRETVADEDDQASAYETTVERLEGAGFETYEISNFARPGHRSRHNGKYWADAWYAGFGLGAHAYVAGERRANLRGLSSYLRAIEAGDSPVAEVDRWDGKRRLEEAVFLGLRRAEGIDLRVLGERYGIDLATAYGEVWERYRGAGLLHVDAGRVTLTRAGRLRSNTVFRDVVGHLGSATVGTDGGGLP